MSDGRVNFFDGIRGWASLMVLFCHICNTFPQLEFIRKTPARILVDGEFAVYIFFVLSGIVLSLGYFKHNDISRVSALAIKRIPRLGIPVFISCLFIIPLMKYGLMFNVQAAASQGGNDWLSGSYGFEGKLSSAFRFSFFNMFFHYNGSVSYNSVLWTMRGELLGSYLVALSILSLHFTKKKTCLIGIILYLTSRINPIYFSFSLGIALSYIYSCKENYIIVLEKTISKAAIISFFIALYYFCGRKGTLLAIEAVLFVMLSISMKNVRSFFSTSVSKFLGKISFPLYIVHMPIICSITSYVIASYHVTDMKMIVFLAAMTFCFSLFIAWIFHPVEKLSISISSKIASFLMH